MKMQKHTYLGQTTGLTHTDSQTKLRYQDFCLTLVGEARLWYESLRPKSRLGRFTKYF